MNGGQARNLQPVTRNPAKDGIFDQYPVSSIQYPVSSIQHPVSSIQYPVSSIQYPASSPSFFLTRNLFLFKIVLIV